MEFFFFGWDFSENCNVFRWLFSWCTWQCTFFNGISLWISECCVLDLLSPWGPERIQGCRSDRSSPDRSMWRWRSWIDGSMDRGRMSMVDRLWTVIFSRTWRHGCKKEVRNWFFKTQTPAWRNHICWICSYGFVWRICTGNLSFLNPFFQTKPYFLPSRQLSSGQQSSAFAKRMGWHGWLTMADRPWPRSLILVPTWGFDENMIQYDPVIAGTGENPWTSSAMIEGMIPISLFQLRVSFCHRHVMSDDWRVISWFVEFRGASGVAGSVVQSWNIIVWYFVMGGPFAWLPGLFRIHYWWHYMKSTFCYFLPSELLYN